MKFLCCEKISQHKFKTPEGYLVCVDSVLSRTGKQTYRRGEVFGQDCRDSESDVEVDRTYKEVFSPQALASFENKPLAIDHPDEDINVANYRDYAVGFVRDIKQGKTEDGEDVMLGTLVITDQEAIEKVESGEYCDLSCGYDCDINDEANPQQRNIRGNHVALCKQGRAGIAKIVDSKYGVNTSSRYWSSKTKDYADAGRIADIMLQTKDYLKHQAQLGRLDNNEVWDKVKNSIYESGKKFFKNSIRFDVAKQFVESGSGNPWDYKWDYKNLPESVELINSFEKNGKYKYSIFYRSGQVIDSSYVYNNAKEAIEAAKSIFSKFGHDSSKIFVSAKTSDSNATKADSIEDSLKIVDTVVEDAGEHQEQLAQQEYQRLANRVNEINKKWENAAKYKRYAECTQLDKERGQCLDKMNNLRKQFGYVFDSFDDKLIQSSSEEAFKKNVATEVRSGKDPKQAVAIAHSIRRKNDMKDTNTVVASEIKVGMIIKRNSSFGNFDKVKAITNQGDFISFKLESGGSTNYRPDDRVEVKDSMNDMKDIDDCDMNNEELRDEIEISKENNVREQIKYTMQSDVDKNLYFYIGQNYAMKEGDWTYTRYKLNGTSPEKLKADLKSNGWHEVSRGPAAFIDSVKDENYDISCKDAIVGKTFRSPAGHQLKILSIDLDSFMYEPMIKVEFKSVSGRTGTMTIDREYLIDFEAGKRDKFVKDSVKDAMIGKTFEIHTKDSKGNNVVKLVKASSLTDAIRKASKGE